MSRLLLIRLAGILAILVLTSGCPSGGDHAGDGVAVLKEPAAELAVKPDPAEAAVPTFPAELGPALIEPEPSDDAETQTVEKQWTIEGEDKAVDQAQVRSILSSLATLSAKDLFEKAENAGLDEPAWSADVFLIDGNAFYFTAGNPMGPTGYYFKVSGEETIFVLPADTVKRLMDLTRQLRE